VPIADDDEDYKMTQQDKRMAQLVASEVIARLIAVAQDKEQVERIQKVWGAVFDETLGRGIRRAAWYFFVALLVLGSVKLGLAEKFLTLLKP
jgi:hypothetical protein